MGILHIQCYCEAYQMDAILALIDKHISCADISDITSIDEPFFDMRICVDFEVCEQEIRVVQAELLDSDWDLLDEDTAVLNWRMRKLVDDCNRANKEALERAKAQRKDEIESRY